MEPDGKGPPESCAGAAPAAELRGEQMRGKDRTHDRKAPRARALGVPFPGEPGPLNAITDVSGVAVGHATIIEGEGELIVGKGPVRTGVTAVLPRGRTSDSVFASWYALNGNGEMTGTAWVSESGLLEGPVLITNTHSVGVVRDAAVSWMVENGLYEPRVGSHYWAMPVVTETYDGYLNDIDGHHVKASHAVQALESARPGPVKEGNVGGGTGMICHGFKGGIGTSSRVMSVGGAADDSRVTRYSLGVLVQANHGRRVDLTVAGVRPATAGAREEGEAASRESGSIVVVVATDAPLLPHQLDRVARRVPMGIARVGATGANASGDIFLVFSTANPEAGARRGLRKLDMLPNDLLDPIFRATVEAVEESIVNALVAARTMTGAAGRTVEALPHDVLTRAFAPGASG